MLSLLQFGKNSNLLLGMKATIPSPALKHLDNQFTLDEQMIQCFSQSTYFMTKPENNLHVESCDL